ncbi:MAG: adenine deaminase [Niabella sp.]
MQSFSVIGNYVDIINRRIFAARVTVLDGRIQSVEKLDETVEGFILPGFVDSHVHIESSMLMPSEFARLAVVHGTVATVSDPHEIANVCGVQGVQYMIENGKTVPFKFNFGAPSCVPATIFETAGAALGVQEVTELLQSPDIKYLAEMMNFPGVLSGDTAVMQKIAAAKSLGKPVDGHAPGLRGKDAETYIAAGISTDHECFTEAEALDKLAHGMKILIREGSAAKNFEALIGLMEEHYEQMMFCSDDKHPDSLEAGHINQLCARAVAKGIDVFKVLQTACINPVRHYQLEVGLLQIGDAADFTVVKDLKNFEVKATYINGQLVAQDGKTLIPNHPASIINHFHCHSKTIEDFKMPATNEALIPVIEALDGQLITNKLMLPPKTSDGFFISDIENDILKIVVVNRYTEAPVAKAFIKNFGIKTGALASTVAHDSHNIIAVGADDESLCQAVNLVIKEQGGIAAVNGEKEIIVPLPVAGLMSTNDGYKVSAAYTEINKLTKEMGSQLAAPFMTLSFMALLVIPSLKLSDKGLFDGEKFEFIK